MCTFFGDTLHSVSFLLNVGSRGTAGLCRNDIVKARDTVKYVESVLSYYV